MQALCQHRCPPFFWTLPTRIDQQIRNPSVAVLFARDGHRQTPVNANCIESNGGHGRFAKRRTTGPWRNGDYCLRGATVPDCARNVAGKNRTLRRMGRAQRNPSPRGPHDGYRCAPPILHAGRTRRADAQVQIVRLITCSKRISDSIRHRATSVSRFTCRAVPFRDQDAAIVQQPSP
jgi:hypothetical protein